MPGMNPNYSAAQGAASGAAQGTAAGAYGGPWGMLIGAGVGALAGGIGGMFGGGEETSGISLPPEFELGLIQQFSQSMQQIQFLSQQNQIIYDAYRQQNQSLQAALSGTIPSDQALRTLTDTTQQIAQAFGGDALAAIQSGFLDQDSAKYAGLIEEREGAFQNAVQQVQSGQFKNPVVENQINDQRRQLEQDLARSGVSPAQRSIALSQFERQASELRFNAGQSFVQTQGQALGASTGALQTAAGTSLSGRQFGFQRAVTGYQTGLNQLQFAQQGMAGLASLQQAGFGAGQQYLAQGNAFAQMPMNLYGQLGQFNFSDTSRDLLKSDLIGPGSVGTQTGVPFGQTEGFKNIYENYQRNQYQNQFYNPYVQTVDKGSWGDYTANQNPVNYLPGRSQPARTSARRFLPRV